MHSNAYCVVPWVVSLHPDFDSEFDDLPEAIQDELLARLRLLAEFGPGLGRPNVDTLKGSSFANMKELRFRLDNGLWRFAFAFDPEQKGIVLVGGNKVGINQKVFYKLLLRAADKRFRAHLDSILAKKGR